MRYEDADTRAHVHNVGTVVGTHGTRADRWTHTSTQVTVEGPVATKAKINDLNNGTYHVEFVSRKQV